MNLTTYSGNSTRSSPRSEETIIETSRLTKTFRTRTAVSDVNLSVFKGDVFGFLGPNGAGKSTTIRMLLGLIRPTSGAIRLFRKPFPKFRKESLLKIGALVERPDFYPYLSARKNLEILGRLSGGVSPERIDEILEIVKLRDRADDHVKVYSQGMKQRLGIAQALLNHPKLVILDEPSLGLDPQGMKEVRELIQSISEQQVTIFLSSHLLHEVEQICTRMAIIHRGEILVQGDVQELLKSGKTTLTIRTPELARAQSVLIQSGFSKEVEIQEGALKIQVDYTKIPEINERLVQSHIPVFELTPKTSLEDFYLSILKQAEDVDTRKN
ncbi:MAG: ABC transporter ATP-binding protein [Calditrichaeota bacterium]|nr:ABC transporter ATP-binding protein [Calditrichota bacterium]